MRGAVCSAPSASNQSLLPRYGVSAALSRGNRVISGCRARVVAAFLYSSYLICIVSAGARGLRRDSEGISRERDGRGGRGGCEQGFEVLRRAANYLGLVETVALSGVCTLRRANDSSAPIVGNDINTAIILIRSS